MTVGNVVEVNFRNKKHLECCDTLLNTLAELEDTQLSLIDAKNQVTDMKQRHGIESDVDTSLDTKISELNEKHRKLQERAEVAGCFREEVNTYSKKKCNTGGCPK